jgi:hypothetical protein
VEPAPVPDDGEKRVRDMTKTELLELATDMGLDVDVKMSKLKIAAAVRAARKG